MLVRINTDRRSDGGRTSSIHLACSAALKTCPAPPVPSTGLASPSSQNQRRRSAMEAVVFLTGRDRSFKRAAGCAARAQIKRTRGNLNTRLAEDASPHGELSIQDNSVSVHVLCWDGFWRPHFKTAGLWLQLDTPLIS